MAFLVVLAVLALFQNCGDIRLKGPSNLTQKSEVTTTTLLPIPAPSPSPQTPTPSPAPPVISDDGVPNPRPIVMPGIYGFGLGAQSLFLNGHWIIVGDVISGSGSGGMWILKEDGSNFATTGTPVKTVNICTSQIAAYMASHNLPPPNCRTRNSIDSLIVHSDGHDLFRINNSEFLFLADVMGETQTNPNVQSCSRTAILRLKLQTSPTPDVVIQSAAVGCFTAMTVLNNQEVLTTGKLIRDDEPLMIHSYRLSDLTYMGATATDNAFHFSGPFTANSFTMHKSGATPQSLIAKRASSGALEYNLTTENFSNGWPTDDSTLLATYSSIVGQPGVLKFYRETAPGILALEKTENIPLTDLGRNRQGFHYTRLNNGEWAFNRGSYLKVGARPGVEAPRYDLNPEDTEMLVDLNISPNGYILFVYYKELHFAHMGLN